MPAGSPCPQQINIRLHVRVSFSDIIFSMARKGITTSIPGIPQINGPDYQTQNNNKWIDADIIADNIRR